VLHIRPRRFADDRGWFSESYKRSDFAGAGISEYFVQDNQSVTTRGTLRGLHYQLPPHGQGKLVQVVAGRAWDVAVDIRRASDSFGAWYGVELSAEQGNMLWIPAGFAHGFLALEDETRLVYKCTAEYNSASERSIRWDDPELGITWPAAGPQGEYLLSGKDAAAPGLAAAEVFP
jgi:dTDP-4-dehydrorhamnose 3,5-epimerase